MPISGHATILGVPPSPFLLRLVYRSVSRLPGHEAGAQGLSDIMGVSRMRNARLDITGVLYADGKHFMQLLEGPPDAVEAVFASILRDPRHQKVEVLSRTMWPKRGFADWSMALVDPDTLRSAMGDIGDPVAAEPTGFVSIMRSVLSLAS